MLLVAAGGSLGALARWGVGTVVVGPAGTLLVNAAGSFLLAVLTARPRPAIRLTAATGFCSSFTTYSALATESIALGSLAGTGYLLATYAAGLFAAHVGSHLGGDG